MISWKKEPTATVEIVDALGPDPVGYITYGADGRMHAIVVRRDRLAPETLPPTDTEKLRLFDSMLAYLGSYTLDDGKVIHHVDVSWNQALTKTELIRFYKLTNDARSMRQIAQGLGGSRCGSINARGRPWASKHLPIDYEQCCSDQLNPPHKDGVIGRRLVDSWKIVGCCASG